MSTKRKATFMIREDKQHHIEAHVGGFCFRIVRGRLELLVGRRRKERELFPGKWECGGGQVHRDESFQDAYRRQLFEEFGVEVLVASVFTTYEIIRPRKPKIPGVKFLAFVKNAEDEVVMNRREFCEWKWVTEAECRRLQMIPGVIADARAAFKVARDMAPKGTRVRRNRPTIGFQKPKA